MARILVLGAKVPFTRGGQEALVESLMSRLRLSGHEVDLVEIPYAVSKRRDLLKIAAFWRTFDFNRFGGKDVDLIIATKFPTYYAKHPRKSVWLVHQHRPLYELHGTNYSDFSDELEDEFLRRALTEGDARVLGEANFVGAISRNVSERLLRFNGVQSEALYPPLPLGYRSASNALGNTNPGDNNLSDAVPGDADGKQRLQYYCVPRRSRGGDNGNSGVVDSEQAKGVEATRAYNEDYILSVGRLCRIKRVDMLIKAMPLIPAGLKLKIVGKEDDAGTLDYLKGETHKHHLEDRIEFLGGVSNQQLLDLYANSAMVYYAPLDEDYGYVTLEAFASGKPVVTATDSGGVLEFVQDGVNGLVVEPELESLAAACTRLYNDPDLANQLGAHGRESLEGWHVTEDGWDYLIGRLLSPLAVAVNESGTVKEGRDFKEYSDVKEDSDIKEGSDVKEGSGKLVAGA